MNKTRQSYLLDKTHVVLTTKRNQDEFQKNEQYKGTIGTIRILVDHRQNLG